MSFMDRWGHKEESNSKSRQTRSASSSMKPSNGDDAPRSKTSVSTSVPLKRKQDKTAATSPLKNRKTDTLKKTSVSSVAPHGSSNSSPEEILVRLLSQTKSTNPGPNTGGQNLQATQPTTPFEELLCTLVIARPIKHTLGHRAFRTLLSPPYSLHTPRSIIDAGEKRVFEGLSDARTLHKDKTASQLVALARTTISKFEFPGDKGADNGLETGLAKLRKDSRGNGPRLKELLSKEVKGLGPMGSEIFLRRVQRYWSEFCPYVDARTMSALEDIGLPSDGNDLKALLQDCWSKIDLSGLEELKGLDEEEQKRFAFVETLKWAVDAELKGKGAR